MQDFCLTQSTEKELHDYIGFLALQQAMTEHAHRNLWLQQILHCSSQHEALLVVKILGRGQG
eukprot:931570-Amphidinium_carterae.1